MEVGRGGRPWGWKAEDAVAVGVVVLCRRVVAAARAAAEVDLGHPSLSLGREGKGREEKEWGGGEGGVVWWRAGGDEVAGRVGGEEIGGGGGGRPVWVGALESNRIERERRSGCSAAWLGWVGYALVDPLRQMA